MNRERVRPQSRDRRRIPGAVRRAWRRRVSRRQDRRREHRQQERRGQEAEDRTITRAKIKRRTLTRAEISPRTLASLRRPAGEPGSTGATGQRGPSDVYEAVQSNAFVPATAGHTLGIELAGLPAGSYAVYATAAIGPTTNTSVNRESGQCAPSMRVPSGLGVVPRHVVHPGLLGGWGCRSHQSQGGHRMKLHANAAHLSEEPRLLVRAGCRAGLVADGGGRGRRSQRAHRARKWVRALPRRGRGGLCSIAPRRRSRSRTARRRARSRRSRRCGGCG